MRRKDREITGINELLAVIGRCKVCRIGLADKNQAYVIPLNFGYTYDNGSLTLFFHSAPEGKKIDIIKTNNKACFELDCDHKLLEGKQACDYSFGYTSVVGFGAIKFIDEEQEKIRALNTIMKHQTGEEIQRSYRREQLDAVVIYKMDVNGFTGKRHIQ